MSISPICDIRDFLSKGLVLDDYVKYDISDNGNAIGYYIMRDHEAPLYVRLTSVSSSFWKVFECNDVYKGTCIFIPDIDYIVSCVGFGDREALVLCSQWIDYLKIFPCVDEYYRDGDTESESIIDRSIIPQSIIDV